MTLTQMIDIHALACWVSSGKLNSPRTHLQSTVSFARSKTHFVQGLQYSSDNLTLANSRIPDNLHNHYSYNCMLPHLLH